MRPGIIPFLVGRTKELEKLSEILRLRRSAVITQYGGAGKTELMDVFAACVEHENKVAGRVYCVAVDGELADVLNSLTRLVEKFTRRCLWNCRNWSALTYVVHLTLQYS